MESIYSFMIEEAQVYQKFKSPNGRDILDFPLHVPMGIDMLAFLEETFEKYYDLLEHICTYKNIDVSTVNLNTIKELGGTILTVLKHFRNGKIADAYILFEKQMDKNYKLLPIWNMEGGEYYRMRKETKIERGSQLHPLPPELRYLSGGMRFSIPGYTCFYIGHSESVCQKEINSTGTMIKVIPKEDVIFRVLDLTYSQDMRKGSEDEGKFIQIWPLIASCYIKQFYCLLGERVCQPRAIKFCEEYVIPQFLTIYLRKNHDDINGIRYYTVKDVHLDVFGEGEKNMRNIVLYVDSSSDYSYDKFVGKFEWGEPYNV